MNTIYKNRVPHKEKSFLGHLKCWLHGCVLFVKTLNCILKIYVFYSMQIHTSNLKKRKKKIYKKETQRVEQGKQTKHMLPAGMGSARRAPGKARSSANTPVGVDPGSGPDGQMASYKPLSLLFPLLLVGVSQH